MLVGLIIIGILISLFIGLRLTWSFSAQFLILYNFLMFGWRAVKIDKPILFILKIIIPISLLLFSLMFINKIDRGWKNVIASILICLITFFYLFFSREKRDNIDKSYFLDIFNKPLQKLTTFNINYSNYIWILLTVIYSSYVFKVE